MAVMMMTILLAFVSVASADDTDGTSRVKIDVSSSNVMEGDSVTVECRLQQYEPGMFVYWYKQQGADRQHFATNKLLTDMYKSINRYSTEVRTSDTTVTFVLRIRDVQLEDGGLYICRLPIEDTEDAGSLIVRAPVKSIHLYGLSAEGQSHSVEYADGEHVEFNENDEYYFRCAATGSNPSPTFTLTLHGQVVNKGFSEPRVIQHESGIPTLQRVVYRAEVDSVEPVIIRREYNSLELRCSAAVPGQTLVPEVHIVPVLRFAPVVTCVKEQVEVPLNQVSVQLQCVVHAEPRLDYIAWHFEFDDVNKTLRHGESAGTYSVNAEEGVPTPDAITIRLVIDRATTQTFRHYHLVARNDRGEAVKSVLVTRDTSLEATPPSNVNSALPITTTTTTTTTTALLTFVWIMTSRLREPIS